MEALDKINRFYKYVNRFRKNSISHTKIKNDYLITTFD